MDEYTKVFGGTYGERGDESNNKGKEKEHHCKKKRVYMNSYLCISLKL
jgi:hypothetical protein